jgi:imidazolonepropionase-like amidohydrolase
MTRAEGGMSRFAATGGHVLQFDEQGVPYFVDNRAVLVDGERVADIVPVSEVPAGWGNVLVGAGERWVIPGLIDTHVHLAHDGQDVAQKYEPDPMVSLRMLMNAQLDLRSGVTAVRDCGAKHHIDVAFREARRKCLITAPFVFISGQPIIMTGGHTYYMGREADGPAEVAKAVREQLKAQVDWIKLMVTGGVMTPGMEFSAQQLTDEEIQAAVAIAAMAGRPVAAHAQAGPGVTAALKAGIRTLEHGLVLTDEDIRLLCEREIFYIPTLTAFTQIAEDGPRLGLPQYAIEKARQAVEVHSNSFRRALAAGVRIAVGTDLRHGTILLEMLRMQELGMSAGRALHAATLGAAQAIGQDRHMGSLSAGKYANMVVLDVDPLRDLRALERVRRVYLAGRLTWEDGRWVQ